MTYSPWGDFATNWPDWTADRTRQLPGNLCGYIYAPTKTVYMCCTLNRNQLRCTLAHEIGHLERGGNPHPRGGRLYLKEELAVDRIVAARLITVADVARCAAWTDDRHAWASELRVSRHILDVFLDGLTPAERRAVAS